LLLVGQRCFAGKVVFSISIGLGIFGILVSYAFCQLPKFEPCAIIFSSLQYGLAPVRGLGVDGVRPTMRAADGGYAARFLSVFLALGFSRFDGLFTLPSTAANADR
jgi:hypothetical protein